MTEPSHKRPSARPESGGHQLYAVTEAGLEALEVQPHVRDVSRAFDDLPLGIYEALRTFEHERFFGLEEHVDRAQRSIRAAGLDSVLDRDTLHRGIDRAARDYPGDDCRLRFDVLAGPARALGTESRILLALSPLALPPPAAYTDGVGVQLLRDLRRPAPEVKEASFVIERREHAWDPVDNYEPMMVDGQERLLEGVSSNFCAIRAGVLRTAPKGVLPGVTVGFVLGLAREAGLEVVMEPVHASELATLDEAFLTSSVRSIVPIVRIAGVSVGDGRPGPATRALMDAYRSLALERARPAWPR